MKEYKIPVALTAGLAACLCVAAVSQQSPQPVGHLVVTLQGNPVLWQFRQTQTNGTVDYTKYQWGGIRVYNADSSQGAPTFDFPVGDSPGYYSTNGFAQTIADLLDQGFERFSTSSDGLTVTLVKSSKRL